MSDLVSFSVADHAKLQEVCRETIARSSDENEAFFVCNVADVLGKYQRWVVNLPRVQPYYAMKCNPNPIVLKLLATLGCGFDCASQDEISKILALGVPSDEIIFANPCKPSSHIRFACAHDVHRMTFDNELELHKIKQIHPDAQVVLRILCDDSKSVCQLGKKFGCNLKKVPHLLRVAKELALNVIGVSFHVGSGCTDPSAHGKAIEAAHGVFQLGEELGFTFSLLDIGGGFPGTLNGPVKLEDMSCSINAALDKYFPVESGIKIIAEPGRYMVASAFTLAVNVIAKTEVANNDKGVHFMYYLSDGVYGAFNCVMFDHANPLSTPFFLKDFEGQPLHGSTLWGPTCDCVDCIAECFPLPELDVGDWLFFPNMGAYTSAAASKFNGFQHARNYYMIEQSFWNLINAGSDVEDTMEEAAATDELLMFVETDEEYSTPSDVEPTFSRRGHRSSSMLNSLRCCPRVR